MLRPVELLDRFSDPAEDGAESSATGSDAVAIWEFPRGVDHALVAETAEHGYEAPDFFAAQVASADDTITVEVTGGVARYDDRILYFVDRRGAFELVARDAGWDGGALRVRLVLRAL